MRRYRFEYLDDPEAEPIYAEFADDQAAIMEAHLAVIDATLDRLAQISMFGKMTIAVYSDTGDLIVTAKIDAY